MDIIYTRNKIVRMIHKVIVLKETAMYYLNERNEENTKKIFPVTLTITVIPFMFLAFAVINSLSGYLVYESFAQTTTTPNQSSQPFKVIVGVTNNADNDKVGSLHLMVDGTTVVKNLNGILFPAKQTMTFPIEISQSQIIAGNKYTVEVIYGDDLSKRKYDYISNSPQSNSPQVINIAIP